MTESTAKRRPGRPLGSGKPPEEKRQHISLRVDPDLLDALKAMGDDWRAKAEAILRGAVLP